MRILISVTLLAASVLGIPSSLLEDVKAAQLSQGRSSITVQRPNKVKRAQEVLLYGDQQNQAGDGPNYSAFPRASKRSGKESGSSFKYRGDGEQMPLIGSPLNSDFLGEQGDVDDVSNYYAPLEEDPRMKRALVKRRGLTRVRSKRDLEAKQRALLFALWLAELSKEQNKQWNGNYPYEDDGDWSDEIEEPNQSDFDEQRNAGAWLDGPIIPSVHSSPEIPPEGQWDRDYMEHRKRFMVSKRNQERMISPMTQLFNNNQRWGDHNIPIYRRFIL